MLHDCGYKMTSTSTFDDACRAAADLRETQREFDLRMDRLARARSDRRTSRSRASRSRTSASPARSRSRSRAADTPAKARDEEAAREAEGKAAAVTAGGANELPDDSDPLNQGPAPRLALLLRLHGVRNLREAFAQLLEQVREHSRAPVLARAAHPLGWSRAHAGDARGAGSC